MTHLLCSTGVVSREPDVTDPRALLDRLTLVEAAGFELVVYTAWYDMMDEVVDVFRRAGMPFPVVHAEKSIGPLLNDATPEMRDLALERLIVNCRMAQAVGAGILVLHLWGLPESDRHIERSLALLPRCADTCEAHGVELSIETIPCLERTPLELVQVAVDAEPRISVTLDVEFLAMHDQIDDVHAFATRGKQVRIRHLHVKDFDGRPLDASGRRRYLHPGEGVVDFAAFFATLRDVQFDGTVSLEASVVDQSGVVDLSRANMSLAHLRQLIGDVPGRT